MVRGICVPITTALPLLLRHGPVWGAGLQQLEVVDHLNQSVQRSHGHGKLDGRAVDIGEDKHKMLAIVRERAATNIGKESCFGFHFTEIGCSITRYQTCLLLANAAKVAAVPLQP